MDPRNHSSLIEGLTFDDVLLRPGLSELLPSDADIRSRITRGIALNIPNHGFDRVDECWLECHRDKFQTSVPC